MIIICIKIFLARILDVSLGTVKTYLMVKGQKIPATFLSFFEVLIWFLIAREALTVGISNLWIPISYALGYATGTFLGTYITDNIINSFVTVQIITKKENDKIIDILRENGFGVSVVNLNNTKDGIKKNMLFVEINKKSLNHLRKIIENSNDNYFFTINETKYVQNGIIK